jgi:ubiquinone/menaquinone biosynthesis C-methylase UbiE
MGAGTGNLSLLLADAYPGVGRIILVEPSESKLDGARARARRRVPLEIGNRMNRASLQRSSASMASNQ